MFIGLVSGPKRTKLNGTCAAGEFEPQPKPKPPVPMWRLGAEMEMDIRQIESRVKRVYEQYVFILNRILIIYIRMIYNLSFIEI